MIPQNYIHLEGREADQMLKLYEALDDHEDVQIVSANFDIDTAAMEQQALVQLNQNDPSRCRNR
jgi:hypothetical protein